MKPQTRFLAKPVHFLLCLQSSAAQIWIKEAANVQLEHLWLRLAALTSHNEKKIQ